MSCQKNHRNNISLTRLSNLQGGTGRHICCGCALEQGFLDGFNQIEPNFRPDELPESQAKGARHKNAKEAYDIGYGIGYDSSK